MYELHLKKEKKKISFTPHFELKTFQKFHTDIGPLILFFFFSLPKYKHVKHGDMLSTIKRLTGYLQLHH